MRYTPEELLNKFYEYKATRKKVLKELYDSKQAKMVTRTVDLPLTLVSFCVYAEMSKQTLNNYKDKPEYGEVTATIWQECEADLIDGALLFQNHAEFAKHLLIQAHGHTNKQEVNVTGGLLIAPVRQLSLDNCDVEKLKLALEKQKEVLTLIGDDVLDENDKA